MSNYRNPFRMRASEKIESDSSFLRLYSPIVLDSLFEKQQKSELWNNIFFIHSSPGAGKTSLLRIFQPNSLVTLFNHRSNKTYKDLFSSLKKLNVISDENIELLGVFLSCARNYAVLEDISVDPSQKQRLFFALLNARVVMSTLRGIITLKKGKFPDNLNDISFNYANENNDFIDLIFPCNGEDLFKWAKNIEEKVYEALDSFAPLSEIQPKGHNELFSISALTPENVTYAGEPVCDKILFMLDDAHKLSVSQRQSLKQFLIEKRSSSNIWISERLEALEPDENLPLGAYINRDFHEINLEEYWRNNPKKFENILLNIADKRAKLSTEVQIDSFQDCIDSDLDEDSYKEKFVQSSILTIEKMTKLTSFTNRYEEWLNYASNISATPMEKSQFIKGMEILISRDVNKPQLSFDFPLSSEDLKEKVNSTINSTAELFLANEFSIPYYYGIQNIVKLSSANIEQFLSFAAALFEEVLSNNVSREQLSVSAERQEKVTSLVVSEKWKELPKILPYNTAVMKFLTAFGELAYKETYKANAPYAPGVTGIGIKLNKQQLLIEEEAWTKDPKYELLRNVLSTCVAFNLIEISPDVNQGKKGEKWMVIYLNRWLCNKFKLPYSYGGWRPRSPDDLLKIIK